MKWFIRKYGVEKNTLLITAGIVWMIAGCNILRIGITTWCQEADVSILNIILAICVFIIFFCFIFKNQFLKHTTRISKKKSGNSCPFSFFDVKSWLIMCFMIGLGIVIRSCQLLPPNFIAIFYTGLSLALILTGILFIRYRWTNNKN